MELPKRHKSEEDGWIKCVEREKAAAAKKGVKPDLSNCGPCSTKSSLESPVEGVRGLISGGYFVGEERDSSPLQESHAGHTASGLGFGEDEDDDDVLDATGGVEDMVVDDEETGPDDHVQDDSSGDDEDIISPTSAAEGEADGNVSEASETSSTTRSERCREAAKQRYGLCALGKWSRRELFTSHDSLGGF